jgi:hypothetical protein
LNAVIRQHISSRSAMRRCVGTAVAILVLAVLCGSAEKSFAQGEIVFANNPATRITNALTGDAWWGADPGLLRVAVYGANGDNQPESSLALQPSAVTNFYAPGRFFGATRTLNLPGGWATLQVRAWGAAIAYETYEEAVAAGMAGDGSVLVGASLPFALVLNIPPGTATPITLGLQPFLVQPIPEPSGVVLGLLGAGAVLFSQFARRARTRK